MTALSEYQRLESPGLWRATPADQRRDVIVSVGNATLVIYDGASRALSHWSLAALVRHNPGERPALLAPAADDPEELEIADDELIDAIEKVRKTIERRRPREGKLRYLISGVGLVAVLALGYFWLPDALIRHGAAVVPPAKRAELGDRLLAQIRRVTGQPCRTPAGDNALAALHTRLLPSRYGRLLVLPEALHPTVHLPGGTILLNRSLVEDFEGPDAVAGYILAEALRADAIDPVQRLLETAGASTATRLLITGDIPEPILKGYAETLMTQAPSRVSDVDLLAAFKSVRVAAAPYAYAVDISGETTIELIEADPGAGETVLPDSTWVRLQGVCGE